MAKKKEPATDAGKKQRKPREPVSREERRDKGKAKVGKKTAEVRTSIPDRDTPGLTYAQLEAMNPKKPQSKAVAATTKSEPLVNLGTFVLEALDELRKEQVKWPAMLEEIPAEPEPEEAEVEDYSTEALRKVIGEEICRLLSETQAIFDGLPISPEAAIAAVETVFGQQPETALGLRLAEILVADTIDDQFSAVLDLIEEVYGKVYELQLVAGALNPEYELKRSVGLELIDRATADRIRKAAADEAARLNLAERLAEITAGGGVVDPALEALIGEAAEAAEAQRRERTAFRRKVTEGLRRRKQQERGSSFSDPDHESGYEDLVKLLMDNRGDITAIRQNLPAHLRGELAVLLADEDRKGPLRREIAAAVAAAQRRWAVLQTRLQAGADRPEATVARYATAMRVVLFSLEEIAALNVQLCELDVVEPGVPDYGSSRRFRTHGWDQPNRVIADALAAA